MLRCEENEVMAKNMPRFEVLSWSISIDLDWFNLVSPPSSYDVDWIRFAESIGLVCHFSAPPSAIGSHTGQIVKLSGVFLLIGLGSWLCCKLLKLYRTTLQNSGDATNGPNQRSSFGSLLKTCYFGPTNLNNDPASRISSPDGASPMNLNLRSELKRASSAHGNAKSGHRAKAQRRDSFLYKIKSLVSPDSFSDQQATSSSSSKSSPNYSAQLSSFSSPIFSKHFSSDSLHCARENSIDSSISEISFDVESTSTTVARLDKLQEEIDQIKNNCLSMDEEFITIKCNRNLPGLSNLIESGELNESSPTAEEIQNAKTCFKGLYSLTTINRSMSLDLTDLTVTSDKVSQMIEEVEEEEALPSLEWDELDEPSVSSVSSDDRISKLDSSGVFSKPFDSMRSSQVLSETGEVSDSENVKICNELNTDIQRCGSYESAMAMSESWSSFSEVSSPESDAVIENIGPKVDIFTYSAAEWKGQTEKAETIRKGYCEVEKRLELKHLRRIRGDNYCAIRATLFQILSNGIPVPSGEKVYQALSNSSTAYYLEKWQFSRLPYADAQLQGIRQCLIAFDQLVDKLSSSTNLSERSNILQHILNSDPLLDLHIVEAVKLFMLDSAIALHTAMISGEDIPLFATLLFSRDASETPRDFMNNYLSKVGDSGGLEMVEMFLLGHALGVILRVVRPSEYGSAEFICFYPDDNDKLLPQVTLIAEDDRHYNILVE